MKQTGNRKPGEKAMGETAGEEKKKELFNIPDDIGESNNLSAQHPDIVKKLSKELGNFLRKVDAQRPTFKATGKPCPWPDEIK